MPLTLAAPVHYVEAVPDRAAAQAMLTAQKIPLRKSMTLRCAVPYAMEGRARRELQAAGAQLGEISHGDAVEITFAIAEDEAPALVRRLDEAGHGLLAWLPS